LRDYFFPGEVVVVRVVVVLLLMKMEDCRNWNEKEYRASIVAERDVHSRTIFAAAFVPATASAVPEHVATASSNGSVALYPVQPSVSSSSHVRASSVALLVDSLSRV
jgi:hypothetical protein